MTMQARYTILRKIADGGTAEIFLATQHGAHGFEKTVVLKRIFPAFYADPHFRNMLVDEAHIAMSLNHNNIVQVLDLGEADGQYALAMDLVDGWTLDAVLRRARALNTGLPPALALYLTAEVCRGLAYAHAKTASDGTPLGIVHRDISPHNVLLSEQGEVKLTDFGIAKAHNRRESSGEAVIKGKIAYMSPEQASGAELDSRSDLFSVGTMLYVTVCRRYPFDAATDLDVLLLVKRGEWVPPETAQPGLNPEIYRVLRRAMATAPDDRYQRVEDMLVDVEHVMRMAFRAVGQTELKRWLQDLSMRDGVPPLTRAPSLPWTPPEGHGGGEIAELKTVGAALPPPMSIPAGPLLHGAPPPPPPRPARVTPPPARPGVTGKLRPPPPAKAMAVGRTTGKVMIAAPSGNSEASGPAAPSGPQVSFDPTAATPPPTRIDPGSADSPLRGEQGHQPPPATIHEQVGGDSIPAVEVRRRSASSTGMVAGGGIPVGSGEPVSGEGDGGPIPSFDNTPAALIDPHPPAAPRKSSTWVAQAVAASAQRTGIAPPPPVDHVVVPPPPTVFASPKRMAAAPLAQAPEPSPGPKPRRTAVGIGAGIAAVLLVGLSVRMCARDATTARQASSPTAAPSTLAAKAPAPARPLVMPTAPLPTNAGAPTPGSGAAHPRSAAATSAHPAQTAAKPTAAVGFKSRATAENVAQDDRAAPPAGHDALPRVTDPKVVPTVGTEPPKGTATAVPSEGERKPATAVERSNPESGATAEATAGAPPPAAGTTRDRLVAGGANTIDSNGDGDGDDDSKDSATATTGAAVPDRVSVLLKSSPPGAQVATPHLNFGATPVSVRFKPGHNYNLSFSREGYRPVTKRLRVTAEPGQEVVAVMRRASSPKGPAGAQDTPTPPAQKAPGPQSGDGWFGRMFGR